ncbi:unspecific monooxygenase [Mumia flava]|uniref:Unspecific monooxygenase n=1 Tax=Mumia flava TaxID=1348852 RepID=A0A2M9BF30_9ACTN|nr:cytochrome P450 [Mumia flava]PJJ56541.1 unspecific monooxygenase [Mumia flava]
MRNDWSGFTFPHPAGRRRWMKDAHAIDPERPVQSILERHRDLGPIFEIVVFGQKFVFVTSAELAAELNDESRFVKANSPALEGLRGIAGDGLFTAHNDEPNWQLAHDLLAPAFTKHAMQRYHPVMAETLDELFAAWDAGSGRVDVSADMTRLTLETIGRTGFSQAFDSFATDEVHPFVEAMVVALTLGRRKGVLLALPGSTLLARRLDRKHAHQLDYAQRFLDDIVASRRSGATTGGDDLLGIMLEQAHPETGQRLSDENIRYQILTFLVAGHETTSGALSFALYYLTRDPEVMAKAQAETDAILGSDADATPSYEQVPRFRYVRKVLDEALRLWPTAPGYARSPRETTTLGGRWTMTPEDWALVVLPLVQRDPAAWGESADTFDPERSRTRLSSTTKPFGTGERACIGRQFALHEATMALARILHRYDVAADPAYTLRIDERLTLMPQGLEVTLTRRTPGAGTEDAVAADAVAAGAGAPAVCPHSGATA